jgi:hypothetical protein
MQLVPPLMEVKQPKTPFKKKCQIPARIKESNQI